MKKILLFALVAVSIVACKKQNPIVGTWSIVSSPSVTYELDTVAINMDSTMTAAIKQALATFTYSTTDTLVLNADGSASIYAPVAVEATYATVDSLGVIQISTADYIVEAAYTMNATADTLTIVKTVAPAAIDPFVNNFSATEVYVKTKK